MLSSRSGLKRVRWLRTTLRNLDEQTAYIATDNPEAAVRMVARVRDAIERLARHPSLGRPGRVPGTRELVVSGRPFVIPYRVRNGWVEILRVFHGSQRWPDEF